MSWLREFIQYAEAYDTQHWPVMHNWENWVFGALFVFVPTGMLFILFIAPIVREREAALERGVEVPDVTKKNV